VVAVYGQWDAARLGGDGAVSASSWLASHTDVTRPTRSGGSAPPGSRSVTRRRGTRSRTAGFGRECGDPRPVATRRRKTFVGDEAVILDHAPKLSPDAFAIMMHKWREYADDEEAKHRLEGVRGTVFPAHRHLGWRQDRRVRRSRSRQLIRAALDAIDRPDPTNGLVKPRSLGQRYADALVDSPKNHSPAPSGRAIRREHRRVLDVNRAAGHHPSTSTATVASPDTAT